MQIHDLKKVAATAEWEIVEVYRDEGISGAATRDCRPGLNELMKAAARRRFDMVAIWSIDRLARSTSDLFHIMGDFHRHGIELFAYQQGMDTSSPSGRMMWQLFGIFAEFERAVIQERVRAGIENAREKGVKLGRPTIGSDVEAEILRLRRQGTGLVKIGRLLGVGTSQVQRVCVAAGERHLA